MAKRSTQELIEMVLKEGEPEDVARAGLVIGFQEHSEVVWSSEPDPLESLNGHIRDGGIPVGIARLKSGGVHVSTLPELEGVEWAEKYLATVTGEIMRGLARHLGVEATEMGATPLDTLLRNIEKRDG